MLGQIIGGASGGQVRSFEAERGSTASAGKRGEDEE